MNFESSKTPNLENAKFNSKDETKEVGEKPSTLLDKAKQIPNLTEDELNKALSKKAESADCRSECQYNAKDRTKYRNYGYSD